jgi:hypothetical protein
MLRAVIAVAACAQVISPYPFYDVQARRPCTLAVDLHSGPVTCCMLSTLGSSAQAATMRPGAQLFQAGSTFASAQPNCVAVRRQPVPSRRRWLKVAAGSTLTTEVPSGEMSADLRRIRQLATVVL